MKMKRDKGLNIAMVIHECNLPKSVWKMLIHIASGQTLANIYLVNRLHLQARSMCNFGLSEDVSWLFGTNGASFFACKNEVENIIRFLFLCPNCHEKFETVWSNLETEIFSHSATDENTYFQLHQ